ncbi:FAD-binding oxidoreductase [Pseudonocardia sediminis]|uniref:FAD-binding oxidoreductase n=1 Tax=Pseudonocardia sediminis TaxID=1397368 RepID=UPI001A92E29B|nr:BBE domain-containing protein [Pseudonocardia sediminis]
MGWLGRKAGFAIDNLIGAELVTVDGRVLRLTEDEREHPDLWWAIRGGGGNFGVVTEFEFRLHEVGPVVPVGLTFYDPGQAADVLRMVRDLEPTLGRDVGVGIFAISAPPAPFVPQEYQLQPVYVVGIAGFGTPEEHAALMDRVRAAVPVRFEMVTPMPYTALQSMFDDSVTWGRYAVYEKSAYLGDLDEATIAVFTEHVARRTSPYSQVIVDMMGGAYADVADDATAFGGRRDAGYTVFVLGLTEPDDPSSERPWVRGLHDALVDVQDATSYVNGMVEVTESDVRRVYGERKYARLAAVKAAYDPANVLRRNANIRPA